MSPLAISAHLPRRHRRAVTLIEVMVALFLLATVMLGFLSSFIQSRRSTEASVLNAACTSLVYGLIEQMKGLSYTDLMPSFTIDSDAPSSPVNVRDNPPYIRLRVNQDLTVWLRVVNSTNAAAPLAPTTTPSPAAAAATVGGGSGAIDNWIGSIPLSSVTGTASQNLNLNLWVWVDNLSNVGNDVSDVKRITVIYTYSYTDGRTTRTVRNREVFLRTRYEQ